MCVHSTHCCRIDGCKYGDADCPVYLGFVAQESPCEMCFYPNNSFLDIFSDHIPELKDVPKVNFEEFKRRREYADNLRIF